MDTEAIFVDGTHIKASANLKKQARKAVPKEAKRYAHELFDEINKDREAHGKKPFDENNNGNDSGSGDNSGESEMVEKTVSTTDPECGVFSTRANTRKSLLMKRTPLVTSTTLF